MGGIWGTPHIPFSWLPPGIEAGRWDCGPPRPSRTARAPETRGPPLPAPPTCSREPRAPAAAPLRLPASAAEAAPAPAAPGSRPRPLPRRAQVIPGGGPLPPVPALGAAPRGARPGALAGRRFPAVSSASSWPRSFLGFQFAHPSPSVHQGHFSRGRKKELYKYARLARCELQGVC